MIFGGEAFAEWYALCRREGTERTVKIWMSSLTAL